MVNPATHPRALPSPFPNMAGLQDLYPFRSHFLDRQGLRYHYLDEGRGEPVLMVHGNPSWSFYYRNLVRALAPQYRCIVPDHMGCGLSDKPSPRRYDYRLRSRVDDLEALTDHLGLSGGVNLVVHDWGGMIGLAWALRRTARLRRLVVLNTAAFAPPGDKPAPWVLRWIHRSRILAPAAVLGLNAFSLGAAFLATRQGLAPRVRKGLTAPYDRWAHRMATLKFVQDIPMGPRDPSYGLLADTDRRLSELRDRPVLICWGARDFVFDTDYYDEWRRRFPGARAHLFDDAGHYVLEDAGRRIVGLVKAFLDPGGLT